MGILGTVVKKILPQKTHYHVEQAYLYLTHNDSYYERDDRIKFMRDAFRMLSFNGISGDYLEFGCCGAGTFRQAYSMSRKFDYDCNLWAFDSFEGLPEAVFDEDNHPQWIPGEMKISIENFHDLCLKHGIPSSDYRVVPGYYDVTLTDAKSSSSLPDDVSFAYIDCDLYSSTKTVLEFMSSRLKHGMLIAFDDYFCFSSKELSGERRALQEYLINNENKFHFLPYKVFGWHGMSFIVENKELYKI